MRNKLLQGSWLWRDWKKIALRGISRQLARLLRMSKVPCPVCGEFVHPVQVQVTWNELAEQWDLSDVLRGMIDQREGLICALCGASWRIRHLASVLLSDVGARLGRKWLASPSMVADPAVRHLRIAEINMLPGLHEQLLRLPRLSYSEYGSDHSEDLMALSFDDESFDYVLTSDTLEHVPDFDRALREIRRVLKPAGKHIFTIPVIWERRTRQRAYVENGTVVHLLPPSHHGGPTTGTSDYLVFNEFGGDVIDRLEASGFSVSTERDSRNPLVATFVCMRLPGEPVG